MNLPSSSASAPEKRNLRALSAPQFVVAQLLTIASTILGVYLAGYVGFARTLDYDRFVRARDQVAVLSALRAELSDNTERMSVFAERLDPSGAHAFYGQWPELRLYLWEAAQNNSHVFSAPPQSLSGVQAVYAEISTILADERAHKLYRSSNGSDTYDRTQIKEPFVAALERARSELIPQLDAAIGAAREVMVAYEND
ncbi:MAG: hypothetical protein MRY63_02995 [Neomegalonema sp.]|nr:hypothetical protein [Neomegalonema sp.]